MPSNLKTPNKSVRWQKSLPSIYVTSAIILISNLTPSLFFKMGLDGAFYGLIAEVDGRVAGYSLFHDGYDTDKGIRIVYLADLYLRPEYRRIGLGRKLIEEVKIFSKKRGAQKMFWTVFAPNKTARKFYWHIGARYRSDMLEMKLPIK